MKFQMCLEFFFVGTYLNICFSLINLSCLIMFASTFYTKYFWVKKVYHSLKDCPHCLQRGRCRKIGLFSFLVCCYFFFCFSLFSFMRYIAQSFTIRLTETFSKPNCFVFAFLLDRKACQSPIMETGRWKVSVSGSNGLQKTHPRKTQNMTGRCC